ncbi:MAG: urate hydroxylase PuuD, partial [Actinomycetota bacterium]
LWWFRWAAIATLGTGRLITGVVENYLSRSGDAHKYTISIGMILGTLMAANVWMGIWKNQKIVLANAVNVLGGGAADPNAAGAGRKALLISRQNFIFSFSMLWFMVGPAHFYPAAFPDATASNAMTLLIIAVVLTAILELNAVGVL